MQFPAVVFLFVELFDLQKKRQRLEILYEVKLLKVNLSKNYIHCTKQLFLENRNIIFLTGFVHDLLELKVIMKIGGKI